MTTSPFKDPIFIDLLKKAAAELRFLLMRGYPMTSCIRFIGNHHQLRTAGRQALLRSHSRYVTSNDRIEKVVTKDKIQGARVAIDGYNVILTVETALMGKPLFVSSDGTIRDIRSVGGNYKYTSTSRKAIELIFEALKSARVAEVNWVFDKPVSGSGEMARLIRRWQAETDQNPGTKYKGEGVESSLPTSSHPRTPDRGAGSAAGLYPLRRRNSSAISRSCNAADRLAPPQSSDGRGFGIGAH